MDLKCPSNTMQFPFLPSAPPPQKNIPTPPSASLQQPPKRNKTRRHHHRVLLGQPLGRIKYHNLRYPIEPIHSK